MAQCVGCGGELQQQWKYCTRCGTPTPTAIPGAIRPDPAVPGADAGTDPTRALPLRWGSHRPRLLGGIVLIIIGGVLVQFTSAYSLPFLALGVAVHVAGWSILPAVGWRRLVALLASTPAMLLLLGGSTGTIFLCVALAAWLLVRELPWTAWTTLLVPVVVGVILSTTFREYGSAPTVLTIAGISVIAAAWSARGIAQVRRRASR